MLINTKWESRVFPVSYPQHTYTHAYNLWHSSPSPMTVRGWTSILRGIFLANTMSRRDSHPPSCSATSEYLLYSACPPSTSAVDLKTYWEEVELLDAPSMPPSNALPPTPPPMPLQSLFPLHTSTPQWVHINQCGLRLHDIIVGKAACNFQSLSPLFTTCTFHYYVNYQRFVITQCHVYQ